MRGDREDCPREMLPGNCALFWLSCIAVLGAVEPLEFPVPKIMAVPTKGLVFPPPPTWINPLDPFVFVTAPPNSTEPNGMARVYEVAELPSRRVVGSRT